MEGGYEGQPNTSCETLCGLYAGWWCCLSHSKTGVVWAMSQELAALACGLLLLGMGAAMHCTAGRLSPHLCLLYVARPGACFV